MIVVLIKGSIYRALQAGGWEPSGQHCRLVSMRKAGRGESYKVSIGIEEMRELRPLVDAVSKDKNQTRTTREAAIVLAAQLGDLIAMREDRT